MIERIIAGDARVAMSELRAESIDCIVTSPPYWRVRDYGVEGQLGQEPTPEAYLGALVDVFREARRVLRHHGTFWLNVGDKWVDGEALMLPARLALALRADGWRLPAECIWNKPNAIPDPWARRRPGRCHEMVYLFAKSRDYRYDAEAIIEPAKWERWGDQTVPKYEGTNSASGWMKPRTKAELTSRTTKRKRSVWTVPTANHRRKHSAVFPERLIEPMILAGSPSGGIVLDPFAGSGTVGAVARRLGRGFVLIDLDVSEMLGWRTR